MEENSKKRCRKAKLVPRNGLESDDENIAVMQKQIEATLVKMKNKSILAKLNKQYNPSPLEFSIKVEVEEFDEVKEQENDFNIKIDSVTSLYDCTSIPSNELQIISYNFTDEAIKDEFLKLSHETYNYADKLIEIHLKNYYGKTTSPMKINSIDNALQNLLRKKWKSWRHAFQKIRDVPLFYKCYICNKAWWYFYDFRTHIFQHKNLFTIGFESQWHECSLIAYQGPAPDIKDLPLDSNCWRCGKDMLAHFTNGNSRIMKYKCKGCLEKFYTCTLLVEHEFNCLLYQRSIQNEHKLIIETFECAVCPVKRRSGDELLEHMKLSHSIRSDIPIDWSIKICYQCGYPFHLRGLHDCMFMPATSTCEFCLQRFKSHFFILMHLHVTQHKHSCPICGEPIARQCMELKHLLEHSDNYTALYKCLHCEVPILFPNMEEASKHNIKTHSLQYNSKSINFEMVVIPTRLAKTEIVKTIQPKQVTTALPARCDKNFDSACQGLLGFLDNIEKIDDIQSINDEIHTIYNDNMKRCTTTQSIHPNKKSLQSDKTTAFQKEFISAVMNSEQPNISDSQNNITIKTLKTYRPCKKISCKLQKSQKQGGILDNSKEKQSIQQENVKVKNSSRLTAVINIPAIPQKAETNVASFEPFLIIKQENLDYDEVCNINVIKPQESQLNTLESTVAIKEEPLDIDVIDTNFNHGEITETVVYDEINNDSLINVIIKDEVDDDDYNNDIKVEKCYERIQIEGEESLDELTESDLIILHHGGHAASADNQDMNAFDGDASVLNEDASANISLGSDDIDMQTLEPEVIVHQTCYGKKIYKCKKCSFEGYHSAYRGHLMENVHNHAKRKCLRKSALRKDNGGPYRCSKCTITYSTFFKYVMHFRFTHEYNSMTCPKCFRELENIQAFQNHVLSHIKDCFVNMYIIKAADGEDRNKHQCKICLQVVVATDFFKHWESHLEITRDFSRKLGFLPEMEKKQELKIMLMLLQGLDPPAGVVDRTEQKLRFCRKCQRSFERKNECKRHFIEHLLLDAYKERQNYGFLKCQICGQDFHTSERYKRHMRDHACLPLYKCELCDKAFSDSSNFTKHKKVHNLAVMICDICKKKFTGKLYLERHMLMHQVTQPWECEDCNKVFYTESSYKKHVRRGQVRFKCPVCNILFQCLRDKWDHMWEVHKERKFEADCPVCKKPFRKHQDVKKHLRTEHQGENYYYKPNKTPLKDKYAQTRKLPTVNSPQPQIYVSD